MAIEFGAFSVLEFEFHTRIDSSPDAGVYVNRLRYVNLFDVPGSYTFPDFLAAVDVADMQGLWWDRVPSPFYCSYMSFKKIHPVETYREERGYEEGTAEYGGSGDPWTIGDMNPAICAVVTKKATKVGRQNVGRTFFGPLHPEHQAGGYVKPVSTLGSDLNSVAQFCISPLVIGGETFNPVVLPQVIPPTIPSGSEVQTSFLAPLTVEHRSRRRTIGS